MTQNSAGDFREIYRLLCERLEAADFCGADPFDALNSVLFANSPLALLPIARLAWLQLFKRAPFDLRRLTMVRPTVNPVTLALAARTYSRAGEQAKARRAIERLINARCDMTRWGEGAWGYPFPWQAKAFYVASGMPNVIATAYAVRAIDECSKPDTTSERIIHGAAKFVTRALVQRRPDGAVFVGYVPNSATMVHNANIWGAYVLALAAQHGDSAAGALANAAIDYTVNAQRPDGSWIYGEAAHHRWVDGFHTGYVLEALHLCSGLLNRADLHAPIRRGAEFYLSRFSPEDGVTPYYSDGTGPLDVNNFAQMAITLERVQPRRNWPALVDRVLAAAIRELWRPELNAFAYQRQGQRVNTIFYPRWTQIWMMHALGLRIHSQRNVAGMMMAAQ